MHNEGYTNFSQNPESWCADYDYVLLECPRLNNGGELQAWCANKKSDARLASGQKATATAGCSMNTAQATAPKALQSGMASTWVGFIEDPRTNGTCS